MQENLKGLKKDLESPKKKLERVRNNDSRKFSKKEGAIMLSLFFAEPQLPLAQRPCSEPFPSSTPSPRGKTVGNDIIYSKF